MRQAFKGTRKWVAVSIAAGLAMTAVLAMTFAGSASSAAAGVSYVSVPGAAFTPDYNDGDGNCEYERDNYSGVYIDWDGCAFEAGVDLPHGSFITGVWAYYENDDTGNANLHLEKSDSFGGHEDVADMNLHNCVPSYPTACVAVATSPHLLLAGRRQLPLRHRDLGQPRRVGLHAVPGRDSVHHAHRRAAEADAV